MGGVGHQKFLPLENLTGAVRLLEAGSQHWVRKTFVEDVRAQVHRRCSSLWRTWLSFPGLSLTHPSIHPCIHISVLPLSLPPVSLPALLHVIFTKCIIKAAEMELEPSQGVLSRENGLEVFFPSYCILYTLTSSAVLRFLHIFPPLSD